MAETPSPHKGQANFSFIVTLLLVEVLDEPSVSEPDGRPRAVEYGRAGEVGNTNVSTAVNINPAGRYLLQVVADGPWEVTIEQPRLSSAPQNTSLSGSDATLLFELSSGLKRVSVTHEGKGNFSVELIDKEGRDVAYAAPVPCPSQEGQRPGPIG